MSNIIRLFKNRPRSWPPAAISTLLNMR
jgi:hypothetical protein